MDNPNSRTKNSVLNIIWMIVSQVTNIILNLISRKFFLESIGSEVLGLNSLFADLLLIISFADLGIGSAISFCLYRPIAENNIDKIRSYLAWLKKFYTILMIILFGIGLMLIPVLFFLNTNVPFNELVLYYTLYLVNNIISYLWVYKETYVTACQKERQITIINTIFMFFQISLQVVIVKLYSNFYLYLLIAIFTSITRKIVLNIYISKKYEITHLLDDTIIPLESEDKKIIFAKSKSMFVHKIGNLAINQTDSLLISTMINVSVMGLLSNYLVVKNTVNSVTSKVYSSILPSMGNFIVKEDENRQIRIFKIYDFLNFWLCSFCFISMAVLSTPFIVLFFGEEYVIDKVSVFLMCTAFLIDSFRSPVSMLREASGEYEKDKWFTILAAIVNLVVSIVFVILVGLPGIYIGTISAMIVLIVSRSYLLFKNRYKSFSYCKYMLRLIFYALFSIGLYFLTDFLCRIITARIDNYIVSFLIDVCIVAFVVNLAIVIAFAKTKEFNDFLNFFIKKIKERK